MVNKEWEDFFGVQDVYDDPNAVFGSFDGVKKDAVGALASCINAMGCVNLNWMEEFSGLSYGELAEALEGAIFQNPEIYDAFHEEERGWMLRAQYLSGNIKTKLETADELNWKYHGRFDANVQALKSALPERVDFDVIGFGIGSPWIPEQYYTQFVREVLGIYGIPKVQYSTELGRWKITASAYAKSVIQNVYTYGTSRLSALRIMETTLNGGTVKVYDEVIRPERKSGVAKMLNKTETLEAQEKQQLLQNAFVEWVKKDDARVEHLKEIFYNTFACTVAGRYSGGFLDLPGLNTTEFVPYPHQKDAVARIILEKDVLLNHKVGTGKTGIIIMGIHERKRIGLSDKNLVVVPNHILEAFEQTHQRLYPQDRILVVHPEDFRPKTRQAALEKIRDEDYTAVYMAFSSFERIGMSRNYQLEKKREQIRICRAKAANSSLDWERARFESIASRLDAELAEMALDLPEDKFICFDELGITTLAVDEAHNFKNISLHTRADGVVGMHAKGSRKCDEMMEKVQLVRRKGGGVIFSTGTPVTNSIADLFVLQAYLQPEQLKLLHLGHFDEWISNFATRQAAFEVDVDAQNYRIRTRFSRFHNIPELLSLFAGICDFYSTNDRLAQLPECNGYTDVTVEKTIEQEIYMEQLVDRTENIRQKRVRAYDDNLLKVMHDERALSLDSRLYDDTFLPDPKTTKAYACAKKVYEIREAYPGTAQIIYCDLGTPKKGFNLYDEVKHMLCEMGVPAAEIAFVHEAKTDTQKRKLVENVNNAVVRILLGSTAKLGTGVNVQKHLIAIHHLDIPWKPSDIVQREGRMIRQGNLNKIVFRFRYITAGTFDAYSWQLLENKQRFISQLMNNRVACRDADDIDETVLSYAEIMALSVGDPLLKTRIETSNELARVKVHFGQRERELKTLAHIVKEEPEKLATLAERKNRYLKDWKHYAIYHEKMNKRDRADFGEKLLDALDGNVNVETERRFGDVYGFHILLPAFMEKKHPKLLLEGISGNCYDVDMKDAVAGGCARRIENVLTRLNVRVQTVDEEFARTLAQADYAKNELKKGNPYEMDLKRIREKLLDIDSQLNRRANKDVA